ncbi:MAG: DUF2007 domain-containing protein [Paramuribaculum sp.]|nr:DUF2007 domain-containing protein [Paramuribaculum sp.]
MVVHRFATPFARLDGVSAAPTLNADNLNTSIAMNDNEKNTNDPIICLREYANGPEAYVALGVLRNAGIRAVVTDGLSTLYAPVPVPAGGYRLLVFESDAHRAASLLTP